MILDFVLGIVALAAVWLSARRFTVAYSARYGKRPPNGWMFARLDDPELERGRRVLLLLIGVGAVIAVAILWRYYAI